MIQVYQTCILTKTTLKEEPEIRKSSFLEGFCCRSWWHEGVLEPESVRMTSLLIKQETYPTTTVNIQNPMIY